MVIGSEEDLEEVLDDLLLVPGSYLIVFERREKRNKRKRRRGDGK
jgi:hypothetical protein